MTVSLSFIIADRPATLEAFRETAIRSFGLNGFQGEETMVFKSSSGLGRARFGRSRGDELGVSNSKVSLLVLQKLNNGCEC